MTTSSQQTTRPFFLGIEGGGTHTVALMADAQCRLLHRLEAGPANLKLLSDAQLVQLLRSIAIAFPQPDAVGIGLAGARTETDWQRIRLAAAKVWPQIPCLATNDLETALHAVQQMNGDSSTTKVLILSGTGSCCYGQNSDGKIVKVGGWGHLLGDDGSGYEIGLRALKTVVFHYDRDGLWPRLGQKLLHRLLLNEPNELIAWAQTAAKASVADLAVAVFNAANHGDRLAKEILADAANSLADAALACARQLVGTKTPVHFIMAGSVLLKQPLFARRIAQQLRQHRRNAVVSSIKRESVWGAVTLAQGIWGGQTATRKSRQPSPARKYLLPEFPAAENARLSPTEQRNPRSLNLDKLPLSDAINLMLAEDARIPQAILAERKQIEQAVRLITRAFKRGGRLFYVGAGTSGRLGVLDASECPPTFRTDPDLVQGIIAGGQTALWRSVEGAEDDPAAGARAIDFRKVTRHDIVVGIAASGRTPFVWGALGEARQRGAKIILLGFNPFLKIPRASRPDVVILPNVGPEILTGSTRLKAGTATKLILNIFTTLAMVQTGKVVGNLMVDLNPSNIKLRDRAVRIVQELKGVDYARARAALEKSGWVIKQACARLSRS
ncbi:MAG: N-acetylmuramic acid 6-phosphate etherase [Pedosphaera sp.]|nr:N-acetylmuramic acid 6-phosphate etherase [Pedosphaera sp.]